MCKEKEKPYQAWVWPIDLGQYHCMKFIDGLEMIPDYFGELDLPVPGVHYVHFSNNPNPSSNPHRPSFAMSSILAI